MLFCVFSHIFLLFKKTPDQLELRCKKRSPLNKDVHNLRVETTVLSVTAGPEASQVSSGSSCAQNKNEKDAVIGKTNHKLESILHNPRPE